jgi:hypothetical protein
MDLIFLASSLLIPIGVFYFLYTSYKIPIRYLEEQKVELSSEVKKKIRNRFRLYAIVISFISFILSFVDFILVMSGI